MPIAADSGKFREIPAICRIRPDQAIKKPFPGIKNPLVVKEVGKDF